MVGDGDTSVPFNRFIVRRSGRRQILKYNEWVSGLTKEKKMTNQNQFNSIRQTRELYINRVLRRHRRRQSRRQND